MILSTRMCSNCLVKLCLMSWTLCLVLYGVSGHPASRLDNSLIRRLRRAEGLPPLPDTTTPAPVNSDTDRQDSKASSVNGGEADKIAGVENQAESLGSLNTIPPGGNEAEDTSLPASQPVKDTIEPKIPASLPGEGTKQDSEAKLEQVKTTPRTSYTSDIPNEPTIAKAKSDSLNAPPLDMNLSKKMTTTESNPEHQVTSAKAGSVIDSVPIKDSVSDTGDKSSPNTTTQAKTPQATSPSKVGENKVTSTPVPVLVPEQDPAASSPQNSVIPSSTAASVLLGKLFDSELGSTTIKYPTADTDMKNGTGDGSKIEPDSLMDTTTDSITMVTMAPPPPPLQPPSPPPSNETTEYPIPLPLVLPDNETTTVVTTKMLDKTVANESLTKSSPDKSYLPLGTNGTLSNDTAETVVMETTTTNETDLIVISDIPVTNKTVAENVTLGTKPEEIKLYNETKDNNVTTPDTILEIPEVNTTSKLTTLNTTSDDVTTNTVTSSPNLTGKFNETTSMNETFSRLNETDSDLLNATTEAKNVTAENSTQPLTDSFVVVTDAMNITSPSTTMNVTEVTNATEVAVTPTVSTEVVTNQTASASTVAMTTTVAVNTTTAPLQEITVVIPTSTLPNENTSLNSSAAVSQSEGLSASAMTAVITGSIIGFWIILGPIICLVCKLRDKRKERYHMSLTNQVDPPSDNGMLDAMIISELKKTAENKDNGSTGKEKQYNTVANDKAETERLRSGFEEHQF